MQAPPSSWRSAARVACAALLLAEAGATNAEERRALLVGVNDYLSPADTLHGAVNDAEAMASLLQARFGFAERNVAVLRNAEATRDGILAALDRLLDASARDDVAVFYYSGHGSQVRNSLAPAELDLRDETIVPHPKPARKDIRDKELGSRLEAAARRGVRVTAVLDSCNSGSATRGVGAPGRARTIAPDLTGDAKDPSRPDPKGAGVLTLSAAQEFQAAVEAFDDDHRSHGAFTLALLQALRDAPVDEPAAQIFLRTRAILQRNGSTQEPAIDASDARARAPLFGTGRAGPGGRLAIVARGVVEGQVELQGGSAIGLARGAVLARRVGPGVEPLVIEIASVGLTRSRAAVKEGSLQSVKAGQLFDVRKWAAPATASLRVHVPAPLPRAEVTTAAGRLRALRSSSALAWVEDPARVSPTHVVAGDGQGWALVFPDGRRVALGAAPSAKAVEDALAGEKGVAGRAAPCDVRPCLFVRLPPMAEVAAKLDVGDQQNDAIRRVPDAEAHYVLAGRASAGGLEYAWLLATAPARRGENAPPPLPLPPRSDWIDAGTRAAAHEAAAASLQDLVLRIARVRDWLTLAAPPDDGAFPYRLALKNLNSGAIVGQGGKVRRGESFNFLLQARPESLDPNLVTRRYTYVLGVDSRGSMKVYYPTSSGAPETRSPTVPPGRPQWPESTLVGGTKVGMRVSDPLGRDSYILLSSSEAIPDIHDVEQEGVMRGEERENASALSRLLRATGMRKRGGEPLAIDASWSIDRVEVESAE